MTARMFAAQLDRSCCQGTMDAIGLRISTSVGERFEAAGPEG